MAPTTKQFILDFSDDSIVDISTKCKTFRFNNNKRKRNNKKLDDSNNNHDKTNLVKRSIVMEEVNFFLDLFSS